MRTNARTMDGVVHLIVRHGDTFVVPCPEPYGYDPTSHHVTTYRTDEPVTCIHCLASPLQPRNT